MTDFWTRVENCDHKNISPEHFPFVSCPSPHCSGDEKHCLDCGVYIGQCDCGYMNGMSGWSHKRWESYYEQR